MLIVVLLDILFFIDGIASSSSHPIWCEDWNCSLTENANSLCFPFFDSHMSSVYISFYYFCFPWCSCFNLYLFSQICVIVKFKGKKPSSHNVLIHIHTPCQKFPRHSFHTFFLGFFFVENAIVPQFAYESFCCVFCL